MRRPTRSTAIRRSIEEDVDQNAQDVTDILNQEAANAARISSQKRKRKSLASDVTSSPARKRVQTEHNMPAAEPLPATTNPDRRRSGRLQSRTSLAAPTPIDTRNIFEVPDENEARESPLAPVWPAKKQRILKKQTKSTAASPFKALGVLPTNTNALINLDESPRKPGRPRKGTDKLAKIKSSLQKRTAPGEAFDFFADTEPLEEEDVPEGALEDNQELQPGGSIRNTATANPTHHVRPSKPANRRRREPSGRFSTTDENASPPPPKPHRRAKTSEQDNAQRSEAEQSRRRPVRPQNPLAEAARRTDAQTDVLQTRGATRDPSDSPHQNDEDEIISSPPSSIEPNHAHQDGGSKAAVTSNAAVEGNGPDDKGEDPPADPPWNEDGRPMTAAERKEAKLAQEEADAKRKKIIADELAGVEDAVKLHGCEQDWTFALLAAHEIIRDRGSRELASTLGSACERDFKSMTRIYKRKASESGYSKLGIDERSTLDRLGKRCSHLGSLTVPQEGRRDPERRKVVQDIYEHLTPRAVRLAKWALRARYWNAKLGGHALREICQVLEITKDLVNTARTWMPRPDLENGVKLKTQTEIKPRVKFILEQYRGVMHENGRTTFINHLAARGEESIAKLKAQHKEAMEARSHRAGNLILGGAGTGRHPSSTPGSQVVDIDDIPLDDQPDPHLRPSHRSPQVNGSVRPDRPRIRREPTEEIPAPSEPPLSGNDIMVLMRALRRFKDPVSRWEEIMDAYGGRGGHFEEDDMDQLMAKAKFLKQTMASQLEGDFKSNHEWDHLRSVPG